MRVPSFWTVLLLASALQPAGLSAGETPAEVARRVDAALRDAWTEAGLSPAGPVDDGGYLRRVSLDLAGTLPSPDNVRTYLDDSAPGRRAAAVGRLLESPEYARHWADVWDALLMGRLTREAYIDRNAFYGWLVAQFASNRPWDQVAHELVSAKGYNTNRVPQGGGVSPRDFDERFAPATNYFLRYSRALPDLSGSIAKNLLGVQIQCAQCHDHPTEPWKQRDFDQFTALLAKTWATNIDRRAAVRVVGTVRMDTGDRLMTPPLIGPYAQYFATYAPYADQTPRLLNGPTVGPFRNRRTALADWMIAPENPWFARAIVNRMWQHLLGSGFVEPVDDQRPGNPPLAPAAFDLLVDDFKTHGHDLRRLLSVIALTEAYQRECAVPSAAPGQPALWSAYPIKPLSIEVYHDAILSATGAHDYLASLSKGNPQAVRNAFSRQFVSAMGTDEPTESNEFGSTVPRALMQLNSPITTGLTRRIPGLALDAVLSATDDDETRILELYLRTLARRPSADETAAWLEFLVGRSRVARSDGPPSRRSTGLAALGVSPEIAQAGEGAEFRELLRSARTGADFRALAGRMKNNADAGMYVAALEEFSAEAPFEFLAALGGATTPKEQAYEDLFWALISSGEFLTNH